MRKDDPLNLFRIPHDFRVYFFFSEPLQIIRHVCILPTNFNVLYKHNVVLWHKKLYRHTSSLIFIRFVN